MFKLGARTTTAKEFLKPDLGLRNWNDLHWKKKIKFGYIWFGIFDKDIKTEYSDMGMDGDQYYEFMEYKEKEYKQKLLFINLYINENYKVKLSFNVFKESKFKYSVL